MAKSGIEWVEPPAKLAQAIEDYGERLLAGLHATGARLGQKMQDEARQNAAWRDRTGNARSGLFFVVDGLGLRPLVGQVQPEKQPDFERHRQLQAVEGGGPTKLVICLGHTMGYGVYLELAHGQRYAIVVPTIQANLPLLKRMLDDLFR
jgi:hypothetical protein